MATTAGVNKTPSRAGPQAVPGSVQKRAPTAAGMGQTTKVNALALARSASEFIEDIPVREMKLSFESFKQVYKEFEALSELTTEILASMGIILRGLSLSQQPKGGVNATRFTEFDEDDDEQQMLEDGVYNS